MIYISRILCTAFLINETCHFPCITDEVTIIKNEDSEDIAFLKENARAKNRQAKNRQQPNKNFSRYS
jgi:hypothetical protein